MFWFLLCNEGGRKKKDSKKINYYGNFQYGNFEPFYF